MDARKSTTASSNRRALWILKRLYVVEVWYEDVVIWRQRSAISLNVPIVVGKDIHVLAVAIGKFGDDIKAIAGPDQPSARSGRA